MPPLIWDAGRSAERWLSKLSDKPPTFEEALAQLTGIVNAIEEGKTGLEDAVSGVREGHEADQPLPVDTGRGGKPDSAIAGGRGWGTGVGTDHAADRIAERVSMIFPRDRVWTCQFPISLAVEGEECYARMHRAGIGRVLFCSVIYSPYRLVLPRYPQKGIYSMEEGKYHYLPETHRYKDLPVAPCPSGDWGGRDLLAEMVRGLARQELCPAPGSPYFANGQIAKAHPQWATRNLYDSADRLFLCFNHPEVREYSLRICQEIAERYDLDEIMLDKIPQAHLEMDAIAGIRIDPVLRILGSICFCEHCRYSRRRERNRPGGMPAKGPGTSPDSAWPYRRM